MLRVTYDLCGHAQTDPMLGNLISACAESYMPFAPRADMSQAGADKSIPCAKEDDGNMLNLSTA